MAAFDDATVTIDTDEMVYTNRFGMKFTVTNAETFVMELLARGTQTVYRIKQDTLALETGDKLLMNTDETFSEFTVDTDATAKLNAGSIWFREPNSERNVEWDITTVTIDDIDEPTTLSMTLTSKQNPMNTIVLTNLTVSQ